MFKQITDRQQIRDTLRAFMLKPQEQRAPFVAEIKAARGVLWNGHVYQGGLVVEGARPLSCATGPDNDPVFCLTNSDSDYCRTIGTLKLSDIVSIATLS